MDVLWILSFLCLLEPGLQVRLHAPEHARLDAEVLPVDRNGVQVAVKAVPVSDQIESEYRVVSSSENGGKNVSLGVKTTLETETTESLLGRRYQSPYSVEELLNLVIPNKSSQDIDMDPCKAGTFIGDIAFPQNITKKKESEMFDVRDTMSEPRVGSFMDSHDYSARKGKSLGKSSVPSRGLSVLSSRNDKSSKLKQKSKEPVDPLMKEPLEPLIKGKQKSPLSEPQESVLKAPQESLMKMEYLEPLPKYSFLSSRRSMDPVPKVPVESIRNPHPSVRPYTPGSSAAFKNDFYPVQPKVHPEDKIILERHSSNQQNQTISKDTPRHGRARLRKSRRERLPDKTVGHTRGLKHRLLRRKRRRDRTRRRFAQLRRSMRRLTPDNGVNPLDNHRRMESENEPAKRKRSKRSSKTSDARDTSDPFSEPSDSSYPFRVQTESKSSGKGRTKRAATARPERIWDYAVIPYEIDSNFSGVHKALFKQAMRHWENYTCIQFVERTAEHPNWIVFTERPCGCCSFVGKRGNGPQAISIGKNCDKFGIVVHELGHVVGFWHEHTRPDRDHWVTIIRENVILGQDYNFNKLTSEEVNSLGLRYDYDSIMHYARNTFSKGTYLDTILPRSDLPENEAQMPEIGQRIRLSQGDILQTSALYNCPSCGRTYQDTSGKFGSPQYSLYTPPPGREPQSFKKGDLCQWRILATHGEKIILNITTLDIPTSFNCQLGYLEVRDGYWHKSPLLAKLCGKDKPEPIISSGSRLMLTYKTQDNSPDHMGFLAQYEAVCGGELDTESGQLESPNFPEDYQPSKECIWRIRVAKDFQVALKFQSFEIENHDNCVYDYLEIRDGEDSNAPLIGTYCGYKMPKDIKSSTNSLWIKFVSDGSVQKAGFSASFMKEYDECQSPDHGCEHECINTLGGYECSCRLGYELHSDERRCENACGGLIDASNGTITSPSFPDIYPSNKNCIWEIIAPPQWRITINFTHFDIEGNNQDCEYDSLSISSKMGSGEARQHGLFCGNRLPPVITSEGNSLRLEFLSDNSVQKNGFAAIFFTDKDECATNNGGCQHVCRNTIGAYYCSCHQGFVLHENGHDCKEGGCKHEITANTGEISSPHYPDYYPAKKECVWIFSTTAGHRIKLLFTEFELEPHQECAYDHIVVYDGHTTSQQILGRFCGSKLPHPLITTFSSMLLVFKSDASVQRKGFMAEHMTVCGGHLEADHSPNNIFSHAKFGDVNYENKEDCDWIIEAPQGSHVHLRFNTFQLEEEPDCGYDFIEVFSGYDDSGPSYGRFCGNQIPPEIISVDESLLLRFKSDDTINSKGFSASYCIIDQSETKE